MARRRVAGPPALLALVVLAGFVSVVVIIDSRPTVEDRQPQNGAVVAGEPTSGPTARTGGLEQRRPVSDRRADGPPGSRSQQAKVGRPREIRIPSLDVRAPVVPIQTERHVLVPPSDPTSVGWWSGGVRPGAPNGSAVLTGHTVSTGGGAFDDLDRVRVGDPVTVATSTGPLTYDVARVVAFPKRSLADHAERVFDQSGRARLVLVTCEDWNGEVYLSNQIVVALPAESGQRDVVRAQ